MFFDNIFNKENVEQRFKNDFTLSGQNNFESFMKEEIQFYMEEFNVSYFWIVQLTLKILKENGQRSEIFEPELLIYCNVG